MGQGGKYGGISGKEGESFLGYAGYSFGAAPDNKANDIHGNSPLGEPIRQVYPASDLTGNKAFKPQALGFSLNFSPALSKAAADKEWFMIAAVLRKYGVDVLSTCKSDIKKGPIVRSSFTRLTFKTPLKDQTALTAAIKEMDKLYKSGKGLPKNDQASAIDKTGALSASP